MFLLDCRKWCGSEKMTFFVDTNFFLQYKKYDQLKWSDITSDKEIIIIITRPVQIEIDNFKNDGNSRRSKRARETTTLFRKILNEQSLSIFEKTPENSITLRFGEQYSNDILLKNNPSLDLANPDDKILAILNNYLLDKLIDVNSCAFLSNDTNPLLTAKLNKLPSIQIPDSWLLEPENDDRDKENQKLKQQILEYQKKEPIIDVEINQNDYITLTKVNNEYNVGINVYNQIEQSDIEILVDSFVKKHPLQTSFVNNEDALTRSINRITLSMQTFYPPNDEEINKYNIKYQDWKKGLYELISGYADKRNKYSHIIPFEITLKNNGNIPAKDLLLDFDILTGGQLISPDFDDKVLVNRWAYPTPPKPPKGKWKNRSSFATDQHAKAIGQLLKPDFNLYSITRPEIDIHNSRDKNSFYWKNGRPKENTVSWRFECEEFRHKFDDEQFSYYLVFDDNSDKIVFQVRVSASNMSLPLIKKFIFNKRCSTIESKNDILYLLECGVTEEVISKIEGSEENE
jgi:hypothetical protein